MLDINKAKLEGMSGLTVLQASPPCVHTLKLNECELQLDEGQTTLLLTALPSLTTLDLRGSLTTFDLCWGTLGRNPFDGSSRLQSLLEACPSSIRELYVGGGGTSIGDDDVAIICATRPTLQA